jgi:hypothetical protein
MLSEFLLMTLASWALVQSQPDPKTAFFEALSAGDSAKVQKLLEGGPELLLQFVTGHYFSRSRQEHRQNLKWLPAQSDLQTISAQFL